MDNNVNLSIEVQYLIPSFGPLCLLLKAIKRILP